MKHTLLSTLAASLVLAFCAALMVGCHRGEAEKAGRVAQIAYERLFKGKAEALVDVTYHNGAIPDGYREQLLLQARQFIEQQDSLHQGVTKVVLLRTELDAEKQTAIAFLQFDFGDKMSEEVAVPMIKSDDKWYLQ